MIFQRLIYKVCKNFFTNDQNEFKEGLTDTELLLLLELNLIKGEFELFKKNLKLIRFDKYSKFIKIGILCFQSILYNLENDEYNLTRSIYYLSKYNKELSLFLNDFFKCKLKNEVQNLVELRIDFMVNLCKLYPFMEDLLVIAYLQSFHKLTESKKSAYFEKKIKINLNRINLLSKFSYFDLNKVCNVLGMIDDYYVLQRILKNSFFIDLELIKKVIYKLLIVINKDDFVLSSNFAVFINKIYSTKNIMYSIERTLGKDNTSQEKDINKFFDKFGIYLNFTHDLLEEIGHVTTIDVEKIEKEINKLLSNPIIVDILDVLMAISHKSFLTKQQYDIKAIFDRIMNKNNIDEDYKIQVELSLELLKFWLNEVSNFDNTRFKIPDIIDYFWQFESGRMSFEQVINSVDKVEKVYSLVFYDWNKLNNIFSDEQIPIILKSLLNKIILVNVDQNIIKYINIFLFDIINEKKYKNLFLIDLLQLSSLFLKVTKYNIYTVYYLFLVLIYNYECVNKATLELAEGLIYKFDDLKLDINQIENLIVNLVVNVSKKLDFSSVEHLYLIVNNSLETLTLRSLCNIYIAMYHRIPEMHLTNESIINLFNKLYKNEDISDIEYNLVAKISQDLLISEVKYKAMDEKNYIYVNDSKLCILKKDSNIEFRELYDFLNIIEVDQEPLNSPKENLISVIIQKIYFKFIVKFGHGRIFQVEQNSEAKTIINKISKELGVDEDNKDIEQILSGQIIEVPWMNIIDLHKLLKIISNISNDNYMFKYAKNKYLPKGEIIISLISLIILAKLDVLDSLFELDNVHVTNVVYDELYIYSKGNIIHFEDIVDGSIFYQDLVDKMFEFLEKLKQNKRIIQIDNSNILPNSNFANVNKFDRQILNYILLNSNLSITFTIINEDPFLNKLLNNAKYLQGTLSVLVYMYINGKISDEILFEKVQTLFNWNYKIHFEGEILRFLSLESKVLKIDDLINEFNN